MKKIRVAFEEIFSIPFPRQLSFNGDLTLPDYDLQPSSKRKVSEALLLVSEVASKSPPPVIMSTMNSFYTAPEGYYLIGFDERGINNFGFFYARVDSWRRVYFRFNYSGVYTDDEAQRAKVRKFLPRYFEFEEKLRGSVTQFEAIEAIGRSKYTILLPNNQVFEKKFSFSERMFNDPSFDTKFNDALEAIKLVSN
jgi:hypothetical protein